MRTKTLLLSAAALVAGLATSQAQVYSQNVVGYATLTLNPNNYCLIAPTLDVDGTGTNGSITSVLGTNCAVNTIVYAWNGSGFDSLGYSVVRGQGTAPIWNIAGVPDSTYPLNCGEGFWIVDPSDASVTVSGNVLQGSLVNKFMPSQNNYGLISDQVPLAGGLTSVLGYQPTENDIAYIYNGSGFNEFTYAPLGRGGSVVWQYNGASNEPQISVGEGFWIVPAGATPSWTQTFNVQ